MHTIHIAASTERGVMLVISEEYTRCGRQLSCLFFHVLRTNKDILMLSFMEWTLYISKHSFPSVNIHETSVPCHLIISCISIQKSATGSQLLKGKWICDTVQLYWCLSGMRCPGPRLTAQVWLCFSICSSFLNNYWLQLQTRLQLVWFLKSNRILTCINECGMIIENTIAA